MPPADTRAPETIQSRSELEEALVHHSATAKAAFDAGNLPGWDRIHNRINELIDELRWVTFVG